MIIFKQSANILSFPYELNGSLSDGVRNTFFSSKTVQPESEHLYQLYILYHVCEPRPSIWRVRPSPADIIILHGVVGDIVNPRCTRMCYSFSSPSKIKNNEKRILEFFFKNLLGNSYYLHTFEFITNYRYYEPVVKLSLSLKTIESVFRKNQSIHLNS